MSIANRIVRDLAPTRRVGAGFRRAAPRMHRSAVRLRSHAAGGNEMNIPLDRRGLILDFLLKLAELLPNPIKLSAITVLVCAVLLLFPSTMLATLGLDAFVNQNRSLIAVFGLVGAAVLAIEGILSIFQYLRSWNRRRINQERIRDRLARLSNSEAKVVREFVFQQTAVELPLNDASVAALVDDGVLVRVGTLERRNVASLYQQFRLSEVADHNVDPKALGLDRFLKNFEPDRRWNSRDLIEILSDDSVDWFRENRLSYFRPPPPSEGVQPAVRAPKPLIHG